jgi:hypothetical protein
MFLGEIWQFFAKKEEKCKLALFSRRYARPNGGPILPLSVGRGGTALSLHLQQCFGDK